MRVFLGFRKDDDAGFSPLGSERSPAFHASSIGDNRIRRRGGDSSVLFQPATVLSANGGTPETTQVDPQANRTTGVSAPPIRGNSNGGFPEHEGAVLELEAVSEGDRGNGGTAHRSPSQELEETPEVVKLKQQLSRLKGQLLSASVAHEEEQKQREYNFREETEQLKREVHELQKQLNDSRAQLESSVAESSSNIAQEDVKQCEALLSELEQVKCEAIAERETVLRLTEELKQERDKCQRIEQEALEQRILAEKTASTTLEASPETVELQLELQAKVDELQHRLDQANEQLRMQSTAANNLYGLSQEAQQRELAEAFGFNPPDSLGSPEGGPSQMQEADIQTEQVAEGSDPRREGEDRSGAGCFWDLQDERRNHAETRAELERMKELLQQVCIFLLLGEKALPRFALLALLFLLCPLLLLFCISPPLFTGWQGLI